MSQTAAPNVAFIFDCDGTLVNSTPVWAYAQPELLRRHGIEVTVDDFAQFEHAKAAGIAMCVATSTPADLVASALAGSGLDAYMEFITTTGEAGRSKQFPDVYELALRRLQERHGREFDRAWVFEDAVFGLKSSGAAGFKRVGIHDPHGRMERDEVRANCDIFIDSYEELTLDRVLAFEG